MDAGFSSETLVGLPVHWNARSHTPGESILKFIFVFHVQWWKKLYYRAWLIDWLKLEDAMEWKWMWKEKTKEIKSLKEVITRTDYDRLKTTGECGIYQLFG